MLKSTIIILSILLAVGCGKTTKSSHSQMGNNTLENNDILLDSIQYRHIQYFWEGAEPNSGLACERIHMDGIYPQNDQHIVTTGGSGFGLMALVVGVKRGFIAQQAFIERMEKIVSFLEKADRFHGAWSHWIDGETGKVKPFSKYDDGGDLVETAFLVQGLLTVRAYLKQENKSPKLISRITKLWEAVEWDWYTNNKDVLYWHWSPKFGWKINFAVRGYNECLIMYVLAAASPTHPINKKVYQQGWAKNGDIKSNNIQYGIPLLLNHNYAEAYGGPLFWAHYSYLGLNPNGLKDKYADYWQLNVNHTKINREYCVQNPNKFPGYGDSCWGLTSSYSLDKRIKDKDSLVHYVGYASHAPHKKDYGVISPTAALSSMPYLPEEVIKVAAYFYYRLGDKLMGKYGFYDAFSIQENWFPHKYLAIDQGPIPVMIENYRTQLIWNLFMSIPEVKIGLKKLEFTF